MPAPPTWGADSHALTNICTLQDISITAQVGCLPAAPLGAVRPNPRLVSRAHRCLLGQTPIQRPLPAWATRRKRHAPAADPKSSRHPSDIVSPPTLSTAPGIPQPPLPPSCSIPSFPTMQAPPIPTRRREDLSRQYRLNRARCCNKVVCRTLISRFPPPLRRPKCRAPEATPPRGHGVARRRTPARRKPHHVEHRQFHHLAGWLADVRGLIDVWPSWRVLTLICGEG
jgi:hypothetical protein